MSEIDPDTLANWEEIENSASTCIFRDPATEDEDVYYDDSKRRIDSEEEEEGALQDWMDGNSPAADDPEREDPLRNKDVSVREIAKAALSEVMKKHQANRKPMEVARMITNKILRVSDVVFSEVLPAGVERMISARVENHGMKTKISKETTEGIARFSFVRAIGLLHHVCIYPAAFDIPNTYSMCVRAVNVVTHLLLEPHRQTLGSEIVEILERTWDLSVLLLGATRTKAQLSGGNLLQMVDLDFLHAPHYRAEVDKAMGSDRNTWSVCSKTLSHLTREEVSPFVRPVELLEMIHDLDSVKDKFHVDCTPDNCKPDIDGKKMPSYHAPGCPGQCKLIVPPTDSIPAFNSLLINQQRMPAIRAFGFLEKRRWWVPMTRKTMAISHLWRDGIAGTRDDGMNECLHNLFSQIARDRGLDSYWIDCATIPENPRQRRLMIQQINSAFHIAGFTLCMDDRLAKMKFVNKKWSSDGDAERYDEKVLLAVITSFWHRRAWTLLEGHKSSEIHIYRESGQHIDLKKALERVLLNETSTTPLWIRACLAEFEAYMVDGLTPEAAGLLLATRSATAGGDSELIWRLLVQPFTTRTSSLALIPDPFYYSDTVDMAFICSNAERSYLPGRCWMPAKTTVSAWARHAYGGHRASIVRTTNIHLSGKWYVKHGKAMDLRNIKFDSAISHVPSLEHMKWKLESKMIDFLIALPLAAGDQERPEMTSRAIILTRPNHPHLAAGQSFLDPLWHWETMVELNEGIKFKGEDVLTLRVGFEDDAGGYPLMKGQPDDSELQASPDKGFGIANVQSLTRPARRHKGYDALLLLMVTLAIVLASRYL